MAEAIAAFFSATVKLWTSCVTTSFRWLRRALSSAVCPDLSAAKGLAPRAMISGTILDLLVLAKVSILAVGLSSLRQMPASVYDNTSWTVCIPSVGSDWQRDNAEGLDFI